MQEVRVSPTQISQWLDEGVKREEIAERLGVPVSTLKTMMASHPLLRGKKVNKATVKLVWDETVPTTDSLGSEISTEAPEVVDAEEVPVDANTSDAVDTPWEKVS